MSAVESSRMKRVFIVVMTGCYYLDVVWCWCCRSDDVLSLLGAVDYFLRRRAQEVIWRSVLLCTNNLPLSSPCLDSVSPVNNNKYEGVATYNSSGYVVATVENRIQYEIIIIVLQFEVVNVDCGLIFLFYLSPRSEQFRRTLYDWAWFTSVVGSSLPNLEQGRKHNSSVWSWIKAHQSS